MILRESVETKYSAFTTTFLYMFVYTIIVVFCVFIEYFSKNAVYFLHLTNGISVFSAIVYYSISVESPLKHIIDNNQELAKKSLNFISWLNSKFSWTEAYQFDKDV